MNTEQLNTIREQLLSICEYVSFNDETVTEETKFRDVCYDAFDFIELILLCEEKFNCTINDSDKTIRSFDTVKQFIGWILLNIDTNNTFIE